MAGFYRTAVIDGVLDHSLAEHVRRPSVPPESPTLGFTHLQFEAMLTAGRESANPSDFALVAMLGLLGLRIFEATSANIADLGEEHGHRVLRVCGKGTKVVLIRLPPAVLAAVLSAAESTDRSCSTLAGPGWIGTLQPVALGISRASAACESAALTPHMLRRTFVTTMLDAGVDLRDVQIAARHADRAPP